MMVGAHAQAKRYCLNVANAVLRGFPGGMSALYRQMKTKQSGLLSGVWAVTWRSFVYMPLAWAAFFVLLFFGVGIFILPVIGTMFLIVGLRWDGAICFGAWILVVWAWRYFRVRRLLSGADADRDVL